MRLLDDKTKFVQTDGGKVVLDLRPIIIQLGDQVVVIGRVAEKLPDSAGKSRDRRARASCRRPRRSRRSCAQSPTGCGSSRLPSRHSRSGLPAGVAGSSCARSRSACSVVGLLMLVARRGAGGYLVDHLVKDDSAKPAVRDAWSILTQVLADRAWVWITLGVVTLVGVWFVGDTRLAVQARRAARPILENRWATYAHRCGRLLVLALIAPLFTRGWAISLVTLALAIVGIEVVRNIVQREAQQTTSSLRRGRTVSRWIFPEGAGLMFSGVADRRARRRRSCRSRRPCRR